MALPARVVRAVDAGVVAVPPLVTQPNLDASAEVAARGRPRGRRPGRCDAVDGELEYKATWYGTQVVVADRWFPSSKTCSGCGTINANLKLADRVYDCGACGLVIDRDVNAAVNLARWTPASKAPPLPAAA